MIDQLYALTRRLLAMLGVRTFGVKVLAYDDIGRVLLERHRYGRAQWLLPGGGVKRGELAADAERRELMKETGLAAADLAFFARHRSLAEGRRDTIDLFVTCVTVDPAVDSSELQAARFFALDDLPEAASPATRRRLAEWRGERVSEGVW